MRRSWLPAALAASLLAVLTLARCAPRAADATPLPPPALTVASTGAAAVVAAPGDTLRYVVFWSPVSDPRGAADAYLDTVTVSGVLASAHRVTGTRDTVLLLAPAYGASYVAKACVRASRRGLVGAAGCVSWTVSRTDSAPPAPAPGVDSSGTAVSSVQVVPATLSLVEGDSARVEAVAYNAAGAIVPPMLPVRWTSSDTATVAVHPITGTAQAWAVARSAGMQGAYRPLQTLRVAFAGTQLVASP